MFSFKLLDTFILLQRFCKVNETNFAQYLQALNGQEVNLEQDHLTEFGFSSSLTQPCSLDRCQFVFLGRTKYFLRKSASRWWYLQTNSSQDWWRKCFENLRWICYSSDRGSKWFRPTWYLYRLWRSSKYEPHSILFRANVQLLVLYMSSPILYWWQYEFGHTKTANWEFCISIGFATKRSSTALW